MRELCTVVQQQIREPRGNGQIPRKTQTNKMTQSEIENQNKPITSRD